MRPDRVQVDPARRRLQQDGDHLAQQRDGARHDHEADDDRRDPVGALEPGGQHDDGGDDDRRRAEQVAEHLEVGTPDGERLRLPPAQQREPDAVGDEPDDGDREHETGLDRPGRQDAGDPADDHADPDDRDDQPVHQRGEDLGALPPEGARGGRGPGGEGRGAERQPDPGGVGEHVPGVGDQRERPGHQPADHLDHQHDEREHEDGESRPRCACAAVECVAVVVAHQPQPELVQPVVVDAEVVRDLVHHRDRDLLDDVGAVVADGQGGQPEDRDAVGQRPGGPEVAALGQRGALVQPEQLGLPVGRPVLDEHDDVVHHRGELVGDLVERIAHGVLELGARHVDHGHHPACSDAGDRGHDRPLWRSGR